MLSMVRHVTIPNMRPRRLYRLQSVLRVQLPKGVVIELYIFRLLLCLRFDYALPRISRFTVVGRILPQRPIKVSHRNIVPVRGVAAKFNVLQPERI